MTTSAARARCEAAGIARGWLAECRSRTLRDSPWEPLALKNYKATEKATLAHCRARWSSYDFRTYSTRPVISV